MKHHPSNAGIIVSGGALNADQVAAGSHAQNTQTRGDAAGTRLDQSLRAEVAARLKELEVAVNAHEKLLHDAEKVRGASKKLADELAKETPDQDTVTGLMERLKGYAMSATGVATAVTALWQVVQRMFM